MKRSGSILVVSLTLALAPAAALPAADTGAFVVQLGTDTTSVERYSRDKDRVEVDQVGRAPRVLRRHFVYELQNGAVRRVTMVVTPPGATTPTQNLEANVTGDSVIVNVKSGNNAQSIRVAAAPGTMPVAGSSPWVMYETVTMRLAASKADTVGTPMYLIGAQGADWLTVRKLGKDSMSVSNTHGDVFHARVDKLGRVLGVAPISGTQKFGNTRVAKLDIDAYAAAFAAREKSGAGLGVLSPRDTVRAVVAGDSILVDYGRPAKRGRVVYGGIVPWNEVWRTGANAATQIRIARDLVAGGTTVPAGFYTLWTIPTPTGWKLVINGQTGQWGTEHNPAKDLYTIDMQVSRLAAEVERFTISIDAGARGGTLNLDWDTTRASLAFTVQ